VTASRSSHARRGRPAALAALTIAVIATASVSACSAGQVTQTANQVAAVPGVNVDGGPVTAQFENGTIGLRDVQILYNDVAGYPAGGSAPLVVRIFNNGEKAIRLVGVAAGPAAESVRLVGGTPAPTTTAPEPTATDTPSAEPPGSAAPSDAPTAAPAPAGVSEFSIAIPAGSYVLLVPGSGPYLQLTGLSQPLSAGYNVPMIFRFDVAAINVTVPVGIPLESVPRASAEHVEPEH
jgi:copper(I)-binding protein